MNLRTDIEHAINKASAENGSDTPDFILAEYLIDCLAAFDKAVSKREEWYGRKKEKNPPPSDALARDRKQEIANIKAKVSALDRYELQQHIRNAGIPLPLHNDLKSMRKALADHLISVTNKGFNVDPLEDELARAQKTVEDMTPSQLREYIRIHNLFEPLGGGLFEMRATVRNHVEDVLRSNHEQKR